MCLDGRLCFSVCACYATDIIFGKYSLCISLRGYSLPWCCTSARYGSVRALWYCKHEVPAGAIPGTVLYSSSQQRHRGQVVLLYRVLRVYCRWSLICLDQSSPEPRRSLHKGSEKKINCPRCWNTMSRWDARPLQGAATVDEDDGGDALAEELACAFTHAIEQALSESTAKLPMTAFDFALKEPLVNCRVIAMRSSVFIWIGESEKPPVMSALSVAAKSRFARAKPLVSTLFDHSSSSVASDQRGKSIAASMRGMGAPVPASTLALYGTRDISESIAQVRKRCHTNFVKTLD